MSKPRLYIFVGYPGAGKTTVSRLIARKTGAVHLWADHARQVMFGRAEFTPEETAALYKDLNAKTAQLLEEGKSVIFDTNFNYRKDRDHLRQVAAEHGAETVVVWLKTPIRLSRERATERAEGADTRVWGNMSGADFDRISEHLEAPAADERAVVLDGTNLTEDAITTALGL